MDIITGLTEVEKEPSPLTIETIDGLVGWHKDAVNVRSIEVYIETLTQQQYYAGTLREENTYINAPSTGIWSAEGITFTLIVVGLDGYTTRVVCECHNPFIGYPWIKLSVPAKKYEKTWNLDEREHHAVELPDGRTYQIFRGPDVMPGPTKPMGIFVGRYEWH